MTINKKHGAKIASISYAMTHKLYEAKGGHYRTTASNNIEASDTDLFVDCFAEVEQIIDGNLLSES